MGWLGDIFGGGSQETKAEPWGPQQYYLKKGFQRADQQFRSGGPEYFKGDTVNPFSRDTSDSLFQTRWRANHGNPLLPQAQNTIGNQMKSSVVRRGNALDNLQATAKGTYLNSNPFLDQMYGHAADRVTEAYQDGVVPTLNATFGAGGRTGSGLHKNEVLQAGGELADSLSGMAADIYGTNYANERRNQMSASGTLMDANRMDRDMKYRAAISGPDMAREDYYDLDRLREIGGIRDTKADEYLRADMDRWNFNQNRDRNALADYMAAIQGNYGGTQETKNNLSGIQQVGQAVDVIGSIYGAGGQKGMGWW